MIKLYKRQLLGYLVLGILLITPMAVSAQSISNEVYQSLYTQLESIKTRLVALQSQISASYSSSSTDSTEVDSSQPSRLTEFRRILENQTSNEEEEAIDGASFSGTTTVNNDCVSGGKVYEVGERLQQIESFGSRAFIHNGRALCEEDDWQPYLCIDTRAGGCSLKIEEPNELWCEVGDLDIPNTMSATITSGGLSGFVSGSSAQVICNNGELQLVVDRGR